MEGEEGYVMNCMIKSSLAALHGAWTIRFCYGGLEAGYRLYRLYEESRSFASS